MKYLFLAALLAAVIAPSAPENLVVAQIRVPIPECPISGHATCSNGIDDDANGIVDDSPGTAAFALSGSDYEAEFEDGKMAGLIGSVADGAASGGNAIEISSSNTFGAGQVAMCLPATASADTYRLSIVAKIPDTTNNVVWVSTSPHGHPLDNGAGSVLFANGPQAGYASTVILDGINFRNKGEARATRLFSLDANSCLYITSMPGIRLDTALLTTGPPPGDVTPPIVSGPVVSSVTQTSAVLTANTNETGACQAHYGTVSGSYPSTTSTAADVTGVCTRTISGLTAGTTYFARMRVTDAATNVGQSAEVSFATQTAAAPGCDYYAGPTTQGNASGSSEGNRFLISSFWAVAKPGTTLCLSTGNYAGANSMIIPPIGLSGTSGNPITIKALVDGKPYFDGQKVRNVVLLRQNSWFVVEGIDGKNGYQDAVFRFASGSNNNIIRRTIGWDVWPLNANSSVFACNGNTGNLFEDIAFFGIARKGLETSQDCNNATVRRAWGKWQQSTRSGPKATFSIAYNARNIICENCIGTWSEVGTAVERYGPLVTGSVNDGKGVCVNGKFLGSISYLRTVDTASIWEGGLFGSRSVDCFEFKDVVVYVQGHSSLRAIMAQKYDGGGTTPSSGNPATVTAGNRKFTNVTEIGGAASSIHFSWTKTNHLDVDSVGAIANVWTTRGPCKRYVNGTLTATGLWPWPMDARIRQARQRAGYNPDADFNGAGNSVTELMENLFGSIPGSCRS